MFRISDSGARLQADVLPEYGGMVARLRVDGRDVLRLDESLLNGSPMLAGGMPLMFPFPSKTRADTYHVDGRPYYWCGLPDSINNGRFVQWVEPGAIETYWMRIEPTPL